MTGCQVAVCRTQSGCPAGPFCQIVPQLTAMCRDIIPLPAFADYGREMSSGGAAASTISGLTSTVLDVSRDYQVILPPLPAGYIATNAVLLQCDAEKRLYRIQYVRENLEKLNVIKELPSAGAYHMNHVWMFRMHLLAPKIKLLAGGAACSTRRTPKSR